jgi:alpha-methylacyl-CoA racemase
MLDGGAHFYGTYRCADGKHVAIGAIEAPFYATLRGLCGLDDPLFDDQMDSSKWPSQRRRLEEVFATRTRDEWCALLEGSDACFAPVLDWTESPRHPHNLARAAFVAVDGVTQPAPAPRFGRTPAAAPLTRSELPSARDVLVRWHVTADTIERLCNGR